MLRSADPSSTEHRCLQCSHVHTPGELCTRLQQHEQYRGFIVGCTTEKNRSNYCTHQQLLRLVSDDFGMHPKDAPATFPIFPLCT